MASKRKDTSTRFLGAEKAPQETVLIQHETFKSVPLCAEMLDRMIGLVAVLNEQRQVIYLNEPLRRLLNRPEPRFGLGLRIGELLGCPHAAEEPNGCGTTEACTVCGAATAQAAVLLEKAASSTQECRIESTSLGKDLTLQVCAARLRAAGLDLILFSALDLSDEKRLQALERTFYQDMLAAAGDLKGLAGTIKKDGSEATAAGYAKLVGAVAETLIEEIVSQKDLADAEKGLLETTPSTFGARALAEELLRLFAHHPAAVGKSIHLNDGVDFEMRADRRLLSRVLGHVIKNALEAEVAGGTVTVACRRIGERVEFTVHNPTAATREVQLQIFQKSFTTKGKGHGFGTYSVRLLTEQFLRGRVEFLSDKTTGSTFIVECPLSPA